MDSTEEKREKEITVYLDRIEELEDGSAKAVFLLEVEEDEFRQFVLPADFLPDDAGEGDYLTIKIIKAEEE